MACGRCTHVCERYSFRLPTARTNAGLPIHGTRRVPPVTSCQRRDLRLERYIGGGCSLPPFFWHSPHSPRPLPPLPVCWSSIAISARRLRPSSSKIRSEASCPTLVRARSTSSPNISTVEWASTEAYADGPSGISATEIQRAQHPRHRRCGPAALQFTLKFRDRMLPGVPSFMSRFQSISWKALRFRRMSSARPSTSIRRRRSGSRFACSPVPSAS